jgi:predicted Zn-dependent protease
MKFANTLLLILSLALSACATNPVTGKSDFALVSENEEIKQGRSYHKQIIASYGVHEVPARHSVRQQSGQMASTLLGTSAEDQFAGTEKILLDINQSFRRLSPAQIDAIEVPRLQIVKRKFNSFETLAEQSAIEYEAVNILRLLNRAYPNGDITKIKNLKTVTFDD